MPLPGDVDVVIASELMETGRAILRGFVSEDRTILIGSTHRVYAISEKSAPGNGLAAGERIIEAARRRAARFIGFDMARAASEAGSVISSVMLGALAGADALPFSREQFEDAIRRGGRAVDANLKGFEAGMQLARNPEVSGDVGTLPPEPTTPAGRRFRGAIDAALPECVRPLAIAGVARLMDYQDHPYAELYLDRLESVHAVDGGADDWRLTRETARHLALWMSYEDTIRVADLKVRADRFIRIGQEATARHDQVIRVTDYLHPRIEEVCDVLPKRLGAAVLNGRRLRGLLQRFFSRGRHIETTSLRCYLGLRFIAGLRPWRRHTLRYAIEQARIEEWLALARRAAAKDQSLAAEIIASQRLIKGYSDTFERGLNRFQTVQQTARRLLGEPDAAARVRALNEAALADEEGKAFCKALDKEGSSAAA
jgi:indolepyruvate ferredoxin oxidoreductase beta subunit